ncbi:hypothetical protein HOG47_03055 [archaeon]|jgi:hypothetical protein|nr:hypothetical protein [archaeon]
MTKTEITYIAQQLDYKKRSELIKIIRHTESNQEKVIQWIKNNISTYDLELGRSGMYKHFVRHKNNLALQYEILNSDEFWEIEAYGLRIVEAEGLYPTEKLLAAQNKLTIFKWLDVKAALVDKNDVEIIELLNTHSESNFIERRVRYAN